MQGSEHIPNAQTRALVASHKTCGATHEQIATIMGIKAETLARHYSLELAVGKAVYTNKVFGKLAEKIEEGSEASIFFYLSRVGGFKSADKVLEMDTQKELAAKEAAIANAKAADDLTAELRGHLKRDELITSPKDGSST